MGDPQPPCSTSADGNLFGTDADRRLRRFAANLRRLHEDPREARRISDIADLVDAAGDAYHLGDAAERRGDLENAERHFRRAASRDCDDASYRLALILDAQANQLETASASAGAVRAKRAQALIWYQHAAAIGVDGSAGQARHAGAPRTPSWLVPGPAVTCGIVCVDIAGFGDPERDDDIQRHVHRALYRVLKEAFTAASLDLSGCYCEDRGDGALIMVPPAVPAATLLGTLAEHLRAELRRHNKTASVAAQIRLRMAVHAGPVSRDDHGICGRALIEASRLLEAPEFKREFAASCAALGVIVSGHLYETVIRHGPGLIDPDSYLRVDVVLKETRTTAWIQLYPDGPGGADPGKRRPPAGNVPGAPKRERTPAQDLVETGRPPASQSSPVARTGLPTGLSPRPSPPAPSPPAPSPPAPSPPPPSPPPSPRPSQPLGIGTALAAAAAAPPQPAKLELVSPYQPRGGPTAVRMLFGAQLRRLREARGVTLEEAATTLRASLAKIHRLESGRAEFRHRDIAEMLTLYGVTDKCFREALHSLAERANGPAWWHDYADVLPGFLEPYIGLEEAATTIRSCEFQFVPELLQTEPYARAAIRLRRPNASHDVIERLTRLRVRRQKVLTRLCPPTLWAIVDEAALRRPVGDKHAMRNQLWHLIEATHWPRARIQVLPVHARHHAEAAGAGFSILRFGVTDLSDIVYVEQPDGARYVEKPAEVGYYLSVMDQLCVEAEPILKTADILSEILENL